MADDTTTAVPETQTADTAAATADTTAAPTTQTQDTGTTQTVPDQAAIATQPTYLGGRFKSAEQVEAYALGLEKQINTSRQPQTSQTVETSKTAPTLDQLKFSKSHWRNEAFKAQSAGDADAYAKATANMDWCDEQLYDTRIANESKKWQGQSAANALMTEGTEMLKEYAADLVPGNPLNETALTLFGQMKQAIDAGASIDQILMGASVLAAAKKTGKHVAGAKQQATAQFADALNKAAKTAIVTGGGAATKMTSGGKYTAEQIANMSDEEFAKYDAGVMEQSKSVPWNRHKRF